MLWVTGIFCIFLILILIYVHIYIQSLKKIYSKHLFDYSECVRDLLLLKQSGGKVKEYFDRHRYSEVAVWGIDRFGKVIFRELCDEGIKISYCIDDTINNQYDILVDIYHPMVVLPRVDVILCIYPLPREWLNVSKKWDIPIVNLIDVIKEIRET